MEASRVTVRIPGFVIKKVVVTFPPNLPGEPCPEAGEEMGSEETGATRQACGF